MIKCDPVKGVCQIPEQDKPEEATVAVKRTGWAVHYVGDPMCSWCWGISPTVEAVEAFCESQDIQLTITMGGLRAGICADPGLDFDEFSTAFGLPEARQAVQQEFIRCRQWGVRSFPTLLLEHDAKIVPLAAGYVTAEQVLSRVQQEMTA